MAKSAVSLSFSSDVTLDKNTYEGNNRAAWRVVETANWMNDNKYGLSRAGYREFHARHDGERGAANSPALDQGRGRRDGYGR